MKKVNDEKSHSYPLKEVAQAVGATIIIIGAIGIFLHTQLVDNYKATINGKDATIESLKERINELNQRLEGKDEQLSDYRKRLGIIEENQTSYSILSNKELKEKALEIVTNIRKSLTYYRNKYDELLYAEDRNKNWNKYNNESSKPQMI